MIRYVAARDEEDARDNAPGHVPLLSLADVRRLPRGERIEIYCTFCWSANRALAGLIGLAAARGYHLVGLR